MAFEVRSPQAVLLDAGGVLVLPNPYIVSATLRAAGGSLDPSVVARLHYAATAAMDGARTRDWMRHYRVYARYAGVPEARTDDALAALDALYRAPAGTLWNAVPDGVVSNLQALAATGVAIAVVSNSDGTVEAVLRQCGVHLDVVIDSHVVGIEKPKPEIFHVALERLGIAPADAVHVGDTARADVDGAIAAGVRPLHLDPYGDCPDPAGHHEHVRSLADVVALAAGAAHAAGGMS